jgi:hypothetical protein
MAEYYGYAERDANSYVDWGKLGQNLTETVETAYKIREDRKKQLDKIMNENYSELVNAPSGLNQDINKSITSHVGNTKKFLLQANKMLKAGILSPEDYTLIMQNQKEDNKAIFDNAKNWQTAWATMQDAIRSGKGSRAMLDVASDVASFGKFKDMQFMINNVTGRVNAAKMNRGEDGALTKGESMTMQQLNVLMNQNIDKYKLTDRLVNIESVIGESTLSFLKEATIKSKGSITEITDKSVTERFNDAYNTFASEIKANNFNSMSILIDHKGTIPFKDEIDAMEKKGTITAEEANQLRSNAGKTYRLSTDINDFGKQDVIFYEDPDGDGSFEPVLSKTQKKVVDKYIKDQFIGLIDRKEKITMVEQLSRNEQSEASIKRGDLQKQKDAAVGAWDKLRSGDSQEKKAAANTILGTTIAQESGLLDIDLTTRPGFVTLIYKDPIKNREIEITENGADWSAIGVEVHKENDVNKAKKAAGNSWAKPINKDYTDVRAKRQGNNFDAEMSQYTGQNVPNSIIEDDYAATAENLNNKFKDLGFTVDGDYDMGLTGASDYIIITAPDGSKSEKIYIDNLDNVSEIEAFLVSKIDNAKAGRFFSTIGKPTSAGQQAGQQGELD